MKTRINKIEEVVLKEGWDALIVEAPTDLYYLTGVILSAGRLLVRPGNSVLFVDGRYFEACSKATSIPVRFANGYGKGSSFHRENIFKGKKVAFDSFFTTFQKYRELEEIGEGSIQLIPVEHPIKTFREVKDEGEIHLLKKAAQLCVKGLHAILPLFKEGIEEREVAKELEIFWLKNGGDRLAFEPHIAFQENASMPHYHFGTRKLKKGDLIQLDLGVVKTHYCSDLSRVVSYGTGDKKWSSIYKVVYEAQATALDLCRPGILIKELDMAARAVIEKAGFGQYFTHSLGHGVGLEIHELPWVKSASPAGEKALIPGMVITIEPGIYLPNQGGIRLEDTIVITDQGYDILSHSPLSPTLPII